MSAVTWVPMLALLLAGSWAMVYTAGGTRTAWPHIFYVPIIAAALPFGRRGGLLVGAAAAVLCGPLMPFDVAGETAQALLNWLARGGFFVTVGFLSGATVDAFHRSVRDSVAARLEDEIDLVSIAPEQLASDTGPRIRAVLDARSFHPIFQPIYSLADGRLLAVEALTRFDAEPDQPPNVWFEEAEQVCMGAELDLAAIEEALEAARDLPVHISLHVNAGPATLRDERLLELLARHPDRHLVVEITEHAVIDDYHRFDAARRHLREQGVELAIDDAGAGFASLRHIVRLAPEIIKLDMSLSRGVRHDPVLEALAEALIQFARQTGSQLIVEGIEEASDLHAWQKFGAQAAQGYLLARPGPLPAAPFCESITGSWLRVPSTSDRS